MTEYTEFMAGAREWQKNRPRFLIDELLPNSNTAYGIVAGRTGQGKTAMLLHLACCFATGTPFFGLEVEKTPVGYLGFEGNRVNITARLDKILRQFPTPDNGYLNMEVLEDRYPPKGNVDKLAVEAAGRGNHRGRRRGGGIDSSPSWLSLTRGLSLGGIHSL